MVRLNYPHSPHPPTHPKQPLTTLPIIRGSAGTEAQDYGYTFNRSHRHSNSSANAELADFKTKFEANDEVVFEEAIHGAPLPLSPPQAQLRSEEEGEDDAVASSSVGSIEEEEEGGNGNGKRG